MSGTRHIQSVVTTDVHYDVARRAVVVRDLVIDDPAVTEEARHWAGGQRGPAVDDAELAGTDLQQFVLVSISTGAHAIRGAGGVQEAHHLDRIIADVGERTSAAATAASDATKACVNDAAKTVTEATAIAHRTISEANAATRKLTTSLVGELREGITAQVMSVFAGEDPVVRRQLEQALSVFTRDLDDRVGKRTDELFAKATRQLDPRDPTSPLAELTKQIRDLQQEGAARVSAETKLLTEKVEQLTIAVHSANAAAAATDAATKTTTLKGSSYADRVHGALAPIAAHLGDEYIDTSSEVGLISHCRKGDGVFALAQDPVNARIVVEMTDSDTVRRQWSAYLDEAERNRNAVASLGLVRTVEQLRDGDRVRTFGPRRIVMVFDPETDDPALLRAVVLLLRTQALLAAARSGTENVQTAQEKLAQAMDCIRRLADVQKVAGQIRKNADKIDTDCAGMHTTLGRLLTEALAALDGATDLAESAA